MPKTPEIDYVVGQLVLSAKAIRQEIEELQHQERCCVCPTSRKQINQSWNALEVELDQIHDYTLQTLSEYRAVVSRWGLRALKGEPNVAELRNRAAAGQERRQVGA